MAAVIFLLVHIYRIKKKYRRLEDEFRLELTRSQIKIREDTLHYIAGEIHDHIGQLLAVVKLNLAVLKDPKVKDCIDMLGNVATEMRLLVHSMRADDIGRNPIDKIIEKEISRLQKSSNYDISLLLYGDPFLMDAEKQLVIFRIFQECLTNIIKHSEAKNISVELYFQAKLFTLVIRDDGRGFDSNNAFSGLGLMNMQLRAKGIGADLSVDTSIGSGCSVCVTVAS